jgi:hypothetical protein
MPHYWKPRAHKEVNALHPAGTLAIFPVLNRIFVAPASGRMSHCRIIFSQLRRKTWLSGTVYGAESFERTTFFDITERYFPQKGVESAQFRCNHRAN